MTHTEGGTPFDVAEQGLLRMLEHRAVHGELADSSQLIDAALAAARLAGHADISAAQRRSMGWLLAALAEQTARAQRLNGPAVLLHQALVAADDETLATVLAWRVACSGLDGALAALLCVDHLPPDGAVTIVRTGLAAGGAIGAQAAITALELDEGVIVDCCGLFDAAGEEPGGVVAAAHLLLAAAASRRDEYDRRVAEVLAAPAPSRTTSRVLREHAVDLMVRPDVDTAIARVVDGPGVPPAWATSARAEHDR